jgi:outer membrane protein
MRGAVFTLGFLLLIGLSHPVPAGNAPEQPLALTMQKALAAGLEKNFSVRVDSFSPLIAAQRTRIESGRFDPAFDASYSRAEDTDRRFQNQNADTQSDRLGTGISGLLPWGATYDLGATSERSNDGDFDSAARFGLTQPLLRGAGPGVTLTPLRIARLNEQLSIWELRAQVIDVITQIYFVYNDLYFQMENLQVARRSQALARQLFEDNRRRAEIGTMSPLDVTQARAEVAARQEAVILAERAVRDNENFLKQLITDRVETLLATRITITPPPTAAPFTLNVTEGIREALESRPDYQQALLDLQRRKITLAFERNQALPRLDLNGSLRLLGIDSGLAESFGSAFDRDRRGWTAGAAFSVPIPNRSGRGRAAAAQLESARALLDLKRLEQEIVVQVDNAAGQITTARQRIASTEEASILSRESLAAGEQRLSAGSGTTFEVLELQNKVAQAEAAELRARADYNKAVSEYDRTTGVAIERNGLSLQQ